MISQAVIDRLVDACNKAHHTIEAAVASLCDLWDPSEGSEAQADLEAMLDVSVECRSAVLDAIPPAGRWDSEYGYDELGRLCRKDTGELVG
jgi:hypothetical protein